MIRNLKALGLALVAALAIGAITAPLSSADPDLQGELTSDGPVTLYATETGEFSNGFAAFGDAIRCPGSIYTGHRYNVTPHEMIPSGSTTFTITPHYKQEKSNCRTANGNLPATIDMNNCDFVLHIGETTGKPGQHLYATTTDVVCPETKDIQLTIFTSTEHSTKSCTWTIKPQTNITGVRIRHTEPADTIDILGTGQKVHVERSGTCAEGAATTTSEGKIPIDLSVQGTNAAAAKTAVTVTANKEIPPEIKTIFTADGPVTLAGTETGEPSANGFTAFGDAIRCPGSTYTGHEVGSSTNPVRPGATDTTITPQYKQEESNCRTANNNFPATIDLNGCDYVFHLGNTAGEPGTGKFAVTTDISCSEGKDIQLTEFLGTEHSAKVCTLTIKAQTGLSGLYVKSTPEADDLDLEGAIEGVHAERSGLCAEEGEATTKVAKIDLALTLQGKDKAGEDTAVAISDEGFPQALTSDGPVTLVGTETGEPSANGFTAFGDAIRCPGSTYTGHEVDAPLLLLQSGSTEATITPQYKQEKLNCRTATNNLSVTIDMGGCDYVLNVGGEVSEHTFSVTTDIVCPAGSNIRLTEFFGPSHLFKVCTLIIKAQTGLAGPYIRTTTEPDDLDIEGTVEGVHVEQSGACGASTTSEGKIDLDLTVEGRSIGGEATPISVTQ